MPTAERLHQYYDFDPAIVHKISEAAEWQNQRSFRELADYYGIGDGPDRETIQTTTGHVAIESFTIKPITDYDETRRRVYFTPMATPADESMAMRAIRMFEGRPDLPLTVFGNPAAIGKPANGMTRNGIRRLWRSDFDAPVYPVVKQLVKDKVTSVDLLGYSFGADKAVWAAKVAPVHDIEVERGVFAEPAAIAARGMLGLLKAFARSGGPLDEYVQATESEPLFEARRLADTGMVRYIGGLLRPSNIAIAHALGQDNFKQELQADLSASKDMKATLAWGTASEITDDGTMQQISQDLRHEFGGSRVKQLVLRGMHHAGGDDIDLHAAIMLQGLAA